MNNKTLFFIGRDEQDDQVLQQMKQRLQQFRAKKCPYCKLPFVSIEEVTRHVVNNHADVDDDEVQVGMGTEQVQLNHSRSIFKDAYKVYEADMDNTNIKDINVLFEILKDQIMHAIKENLNGDHQVLQPLFFDGMGLELLLKRSRVFLREILGLLRTCSPFLRWVQYVQ